jgi:hypothetical protein
VSKDNQLSTFKSNSAGLAIAFGAGAGVIFGELIFDSVGVGIAVGVLIGVFFCILNKVK